MHAPPVATAPIAAIAPLPYEARLQARQPDAVDLVVIHCTELPDLAMARAYGERIQHPASRTGNSGHFYIDRDGRIEQWVDPLRVAHHVRGHNAHSIGIELVNLGRHPYWHDARHQAMPEPYPDAQVDALLQLLAYLRAAFPSLRRIAGHDALDVDEIPASNDPDARVRRKLDPGPLFPWPRVLAACGLAPVR